MQSLDDILQFVRGLTAEERQRLSEALERLDEQEPARADERPYTVLLALAGSAHSEVSDLSSDKYAHLGAAIAQHKSG